MQITWRLPMLDRGDGLAADRLLLGGSCMRLLLGRLPAQQQVGEERRQIAGQSVRLVLQSRVNMLLLLLLLLRVLPGMETEVMLLLLLLLLLLQAGVEEGRSRGVVA